MWRTLQVHIQYNEQFSTIIQARRANVMIVLVSHNYIDILKYKNLISQGSQLQLPGHRLDIWHLNLKNKQKTFNIN